MLNTIGKHLSHLRRIDEKQTIYFRKQSNLFDIQYKLWIM